MKAMPKQLLVPEKVWRDTLTSFAPYANTGVEAGCYWYGLRTSDGVALASVVGVPRQKNTPGNFAVDADDLACLAQAATWSTLVCVAQVHTHPGRCIRHSDFDNDNAVSVKVLSIVIPHYGKGPVPFDSIGVHRYEDGRWRCLQGDEVGRILTVMPSVVDCR